MSDYCLANISNIKPIFYHVRNILFEAVWQSKIPCIVKIGGHVQTLHINESFISKYFSDHLRKICPNFILAYCSGTSNSVEIMKFLKYNEKSFYNADEIKTASDKRDLLRMIFSGNEEKPLTVEQKREIKKEYDLQGKILQPWNYFTGFVKFLSERVLAPPEVIIYERVFSKLTLSYLINKNMVTLNKSNFFSFSFQLLYFIYSLHNIGITHLDLNVRNIWLQPIKRTYKYILYLYRTTDNVQEYYLPLDDSFNYLLKVGDYGESKPHSEKNNCEDLIQLGNLLLDLNSNCSDCKNLLTETMICLKFCSSSCFESIFSTTFKDLYGHLPDNIDPASIITPDTYFSIDNVDTSR